ncbi:MAG: MFS transporter [bacterium]
MNLAEKKAIFGWSIYDWANSAFATTVMAGFFPIFFKEYWSYGSDTVVSTARLGFANALAGILIALFAPLLGAVADKGGVKKKFLFLFTLIGIMMTSSLYLVSKGNWPLAVMLYVFAVVGFSGGNIFYDALLVCVSPIKKIDFVSSLGYAFGYLGGGILFGINVWMTLNPTYFGLENVQQAVRVSFISVGIWWFVFSLPLLIFVKEDTAAKTNSYLVIIKGGLIQLKETIQQIRYLKTILLFLLAYWFYIDGVGTIIRMAVDYGISIGFKSKDLIFALLITQFVGFPAAIVFGYIGGKLGARGSIFIAIMIYLLITFWGVFMRSSYEFYILAVAIGMVQGGIQALSRSLYATLIPDKRSAEFFGFYNMVGKFSAIMGPLLVGSIALLAKYFGFSNSAASRLSIGSISIFFIVGGILLFFVDENKSKKEN